MSLRAYNDKTSLALFCLITSRVEGYPLGVTLPAQGETTEVVLSDQIKSLDCEPDAPSSRHRPP